MKKVKVLWSSKYSEKGQEMSTFYTSQKVNPVLIFMK